MLTHRKSRSNVYLGVLAFWLAFVLIATTAMSFWTDSNLDFWASYFKGTPTDVPFWLSWVATIFLPVSVPGNVFASVARFFV